MNPDRPGYEDKQSLRAYWTFFAPFRAAILENVQREDPDNLHVARMTRDEADDWRLEHLAINADAWAPFFERLRERGSDYARSEMPYAVWLRHLSKLRDRSLNILCEHPEHAATANEISRGVLLAFDLNVEMIGRAYFDANEQAHSHAARRSKELLQHSQKMEALGQLAGGVAHDFNNILTVVQSYASMLEEALDQGDVRRQDATEIRRASD